MLALIAAILFGLALLFDLLKTHLDSITVEVLMLAGLLFLALHFSSASGWRGRSRR